MELIEARTQVGIDRFTRRNRSTPFVIETVKPVTELHTFRYHETETDKAQRDALPRGWNLNVLT